MGLHIIMRQSHNDMQSHYETATRFNPDKLTDIPGYQADITARLPGFPLRI